MEHFYHHIQGWFTFSKLYDFAVSKCPDNGHIIEIGCWKGRSTAYLAVSCINSAKNITLDVIDPFLALDTATCGALPISSKALRDEFIANMQPVFGHYNLITASSPDPAFLYANNSLDFVFIDGSHAYPDVLEDIRAWAPKIKIGGYLAGHDYAVFASVKQACAEFLGIQDWSDPWGCLSWIAQKTDKGFIKVEL